MHRRLPLRVNDLASLTLLQMFGFRILDFLCGGLVAEPPLTRCALIQNFDFGCWIFDSWFWIWGSGFLDFQVWIFGFRILIFDFGVLDFGFGCWTLSRQFVTWGPKFGFWILTLDFRRFWNLDLGFWILQVVSSADFACEARYSEVLAGFTIQIALAQGGEKYSGHRDADNVTLADKKRVAASWLAWLKCMLEIFGQAALGFAVCMLFTRFIWVLFSWNNPSAPCLVKCWALCWFLCSVFWCWFFHLELVRFLHLRHRDMLVKFLWTSQHAAWNQLCSCREISIQSTCSKTS